MRKNAVVLFCLTLALAAAGEEPYAFRKQLDTIHEVGLRDPVVNPNADDFAFKDGATVAYDAAAGTLVKRAAEDFADYLATSMGVVAKAAACSVGTVTVALDATLAPRTSVIVVSNAGVSVTAGDARAAMQALFHLEDRMNLRRAPYLKRGTENRRQLLSPRMVHSGYATDKFPDAYLGKIAHGGFDAILFYISGWNSTRAGKTDIAALIDAAEAWGLDCYLYNEMRAELPPDDPGAAAQYDSVYGEMARRFPKAKGVLVVPESCHFKSRDPRCRPTGLVSSGAFPCSDHPQWVAGLEKAFRQGDATKDFIFWTYNFCWYNDRDRLAFIEKVSPTVTLNVTFATAGEVPYHAVSSGANFTVEDYSICEPGPSPHFEKEAAAAKARNLRLFATANTAGRTWDFGCSPYEPVPQQWKRRFDAIRGAQKRWGLVGLIDSHHYGYVPNMIAELSKEAFVEGGMPFDEHLRAIAARDFGERHADEVVALWDEISAAMCDYVATGDNQYGPFRLGPACPYRVGAKPLRIDAAPGSDDAMPGFRTYMCNVNYGYSTPGKGVMPEKLPLTWRVKHEVRVFTAAGRRFVAAAEKLRSFADELDGARREKARREAGVVEYVGRSFLTCANIKAGALADRAGDTETVRRLARDEYENTRAALPLLEEDSRLGFEPSMQYYGGRDTVRWKLREMERLYGFDDSVEK